MPVVIGCPYDRSLGESGFDQLQHQVAIALRVVHLRRTIRAGLHGAYPLGCERPQRALQLAGRKVGGNDAAVEVADDARHLGRRAHDQRKPCLKEVEQFVRQREFQVGCSGG